MAKAKATAPSLPVSEALEDITPKSRRDILMDGSNKRYVYATDLPTKDESGEPIKSMYHYRLERGIGNPHKPFKVFCSRRPKSHEAEILPARTDAVDESQAILDFMKARKIPLNKTHNYGFKALKLAGKELAHGRSAGHISDNRGANTGSKEST